jgi:hypothetical protein
MAARKLTDSQVQGLREHRTSGTVLGLDEFTATRVLRYGNRSPWQACRDARNLARRPKQEAWAKRHGKPESDPLGIKR